MRFLFKRKKREGEGGTRVRILFTTDIHGSEGVWRKFLNASKMLEVDVAIAGGDLTGKMLVPIIEKPNGKYEYYFLGKNHTIDSSMLEKAEREIRGIGYYPYITNKDEVEELRRDKEKLDKIFVRVMKETLREWLDLIRIKLPEEIKVIVCPGNDDRFEIDEVVKSHKDVIDGEGKVVDLDGFHELVSTGWVNPTPWKTAREELDEELEKRLEKYVSQISNMDSAIFNFHAPPYRSNLDEAPLLDENFNPVIRAGKVVTVPVGSMAVRRVIERYQPLLGLHGHIHESSGSIKIGRTFCVNPGSEYAEGILRAFLIELRGSNIIRLQRIEG